MSHEGSRFEDLYSTISFVIPVRNDASRLRLCLRAIQDSLANPPDIEIIVVDNGSTDDSVNVALGHGARVLVHPNLSVTSLRNRAAEAATGDILAFCDADNIICGEWIRVASVAFSDPRVGGVGSFCDPPESATWVQNAYDGLRDHSAGRQETRWLGAGNMAVRREVFEKVGGFDEGLSACEDVDLSRKIRQKGYLLLSDSRLKSIHLGDPETLSKLFWGELWRGRDNLKVSLRAPIAVRDVPSWLLPIVGLLLMLTALAGLILVPARGLSLTVASVLGFSFFSTLRAVSMIRRSRRFGLMWFLKAMAVAHTYDAARALALIWRVDHHRNL